MSVNSFKVKNLLNLYPQSSAPSSPENGDIYYDSTLNSIMAYVNGSWENIGGVTNNLSYYSGYMPSSTSWSVSPGSSFSDMSPSGSNTLTQRTSSGLSVSAASSDLPGITFTPTTSGSAYLITASFISGVSGPTDDINFQLTDGSTVFTSSSNRVINTPSNIEPWMNVSGIYVPGTTSPVTVKIQASSNGTGYINPQAPNSALSSIEWTVIQIAYNGPGASGFQFFTSSQVTTTSSAITSGSFTTFSNSPAFTFTPTVSGTYKVYSSIPFYEDATNSSGTARIYNTSGGATLLNESQAAIYGSASSVLSNVMVQSVYTLTSGTNYVFDIQAEVTLGSPNLYLRGDLAAFYMFAELVN
jgi:hypothetical protein